MKRKNFLAKAITLGLLLAVPVGVQAEVIFQDTALTGNTSYTDGLKVHENATLDGGSNHADITVSGNIQHDGKEYGIVNQGTMTNIGSITAEGESMLNTGSEAIINVYGDITVGKKINLEVEGLYNANGATLNLMDDLTINSTLDNKSTVNVADDKQIKIVGSLLNNGSINAENANLIIEETYEYNLGSPIANWGTIKANNLTFSNKNNDVKNEGEISLNGSLTIGSEVGKFGLENTKEGIIEFKGQEEAAIKGIGNTRTIKNEGKIYAASGTLVLDNANLTMSGEGSQVKKNAAENLDKLVSNSKITLDKVGKKGSFSAPTLEVNNLLQVKELDVKCGTVKSDALAVENMEIFGVGSSTLEETGGSTVEVNNLQVNDGEVVVGSEIKIGGKPTANGKLIIHENITGTGTIENKAEISAAGDNVTIGEGIEVNNIANVSDTSNVLGRITAENTLTIAGTLNNYGQLSATTLNVANGEDGSAEKGNSKGFAVDNLNILAGGSFALNSSETNLKTLTVNDGAKLTAGRILNMEDGSTITTNGGTANIGTLNVGGALTVNANGDSQGQLNVGTLGVDSLNVNINSLTAGQVVVGNMGDSDVAVNASSAVADSFSGDFIKDMQAVADAVSGAVQKDVTADAGSITGQITATTDENGKVIAYQESVNTFNAAATDMSSIALMTWRAENNDMNKRLGELRDSNGEHGIWTRMTRGESDYASIKNQYNSYQLGYDEKLSTDSHWTVGAALTYTDGQSSFAGGSGENTHKGLAVYGSYLGDNGAFLDLIAKYSRLDHDYKLYGGAGNSDFDTNGYSFSVEYGKRFTKDNGLWIEPQVELTYGAVGSASYISGNDVHVRQDSMDSLVGRVGFRIGKDIKQGNVYARASYLYDFDGETSVTMTKGKLTRSYEQDLGGGWFEVGVGTNISLSKATYLYADVEKTLGGDVATPWQYNVGVRYSF